MLTAAAAAVGPSNSINNSLSVGRTAVVASLSAPPGSAAAPAAALASTRSNSENNARRTNNARAWTAPEFFPGLQPMPPMLAAARGNRIAIAPRQGQIVAGTQIGFLHTHLPSTEPRNQGRKKDKKKRRARRCKRCVQFLGTQAEKCPGAHGKPGGSDNCTYFTETGEPKEAL